MYHMANIRCMLAARVTKACPTIPRPAKTHTIVMHIRPAGAAVVGELSSSITTRRARIILAKNSIAMHPATKEQA